MESLNPMMAPYANALAISLLAAALIVLGLKNQHCKQQPSRVTATNQAAGRQNTPRLPAGIQNRRELSKF
jgi:BioD-like phosphotransacetylase family protein